MNHEKRIFIFLLVLLLACGVAGTIADTREYVTYYPSPFGEYQTVQTDKMILNPSPTGSSKGSTCTTNDKPGTLSYNTVSNEILLCGNNTGKWDSLSGSWTQSGSYLYPNDLSANVGIGTAAPQGRLDVNSGSGQTDALFVKASGSIANQGGIIHHQGNTYAWQEAAQDTASTGGTLRFHYVNRTTPGTKVLTDAFVLRADGRVGVGTSQPWGRLDVNGGSTTSQNDALYVGASPTVANRGGIIHNQSPTNPYAWQEVAQNTTSLTGGTLNFHYVDRAFPDTKKTSDVLALTSNGDVSVKGNLTVGGFHNFTLSWAFTREIHNIQNGWDGGSLGYDPARSICFLVGEQYEQIEAQGEWAHCEVYPSGSSWWLAASTGGACDDCDVWCEARCLAW